VGALGAAEKELKSSGQAKVREVQNIHCKLEKGREGGTLFEKRGKRTWGEEKKDLTPWAELLQKPKGALEAGT